MRHALLNLSLLSLLAAPVAAHAASLEEISFTNPADAADSYTFVLPAVNTVTSANTDGSTYFILSDVAVTAPGGVSSSSETVEFFDEADYGGGLLDNNLSVTALNITFFGTQFYSSLTGTGPDYTATFLPSSGTTSGYDLNPTDPAVTFDYTIAAYTPPPSPTPEPSSLMLLGTGALGVFGAFRRRMMA